MRCRRIDPRACVAPTSRRARCGADRGRRHAARARPEDPHERVRHAAVAAPGRDQPVVLDREHDLAARLCGGACCLRAARKRARARAPRIGLRAGCRGAARCDPHRARSRHDRGRALAIRHRRCFAGAVSGAWAAAPAGHQHRGGGRRKRERRAGRGVGATLRGGCHRAGARSRKASRSRGSPARPSASRRGTRWATRDR